MIYPPEIPPYDPMVRIEDAFFEGLVMYFDDLIDLISKEPNTLYKDHLADLSKAHNYLNSLKLYAFQAKGDKRFKEEDLRNAANGWGATIEGLIHIYKEKRHYAEIHFRNAKDDVVIALINMKQAYEDL